MKNVLFNKRFYFEVFNQNTLLNIQKRTKTLQKILKKLIFR